jgi:nickel/cobalt transporter (NiCoT) family protein
VIAESAAAAMLACVLGARHGLDADHLAAIDGLTRCNASAGRRVAPLCGVMFLTGHAAVIFATALALVFMGSQLAPPAWLAPLGTGISAITLIVLGSMNLRAAFARTGEASPVGLRSRLMSPVLRASSAWQVALVGALFALSFDSVAIAALFASSPAGVAGVLQTGISFSAGMLAVGVANGLWVARLLRHSGKASRQAARVMTLTIALIAFAVAARVLLPLVSVEWDRGLEAYELVASGSILTLLLAGYVTSLFIARRSPTTRAERVAGTPDIVT